MKKLLLMTTIAFATVAASPAASAQAKLASADTAAAATAQASDASAANKPASAAEEKEVCKMLPTSGTRFAKKACLTEKEWKQVEADLGE
jgi:hypothetical protein